MTALAAPAPLPGSERQAIVDAEQLNLLSICYLVLGALTGMLALLCLVYVAAGAAIAVGGMAKDPREQLPAVLMGGCFASIGGAIALLAALSAALKIYEGICLRQRRSRLACMVIAGITCLDMPLGTLLGVFSLVVLARPSVERLFESAAAPVRPAG